MILVGADDAVDGCYPSAESAIFETVGLRLLTGATLRPWHTSSRRGGLLSRISAGRICPFFFYRREY